MFQSLIAFLILVLFPQFAFSAGEPRVRNPQIFYKSVSIGDSNIAVSSAILDVKSTNSGVLLPRMTTTQKNSISSPATGLMVFDTSLNQYQVYNGASWTGLAVTSVAMTVPSFLSVSGSPITTSGTLALSLSGTALPVSSGGTGQTSLTNHGVLVGAGTGGATQLSAAAAGTVLTGQGSSADPSFSATPTLGVAGSTTGSLAMAGLTSGTVTLQAQDVAGTPTLKLPNSVGSANQFLKTDGGTPAILSWGTPSGSSAIYYYSGYSNCSVSNYSVTSATYAAFAGTTCTLTQVVNNGAGTVTGSTTIPQITLTVNTATYKVCAYATAFSSTSGADASLKLWDGTTIINEADWRVPSANNRLPIPVCGGYSGTAGSVTFSLQGLISSGTLVIGASSARQSITWTVEEIH